MRKRSLLAFLLVIAMLATSGCSLIVKDEEVDRATVIIEAAGKTVTKGAVQDQTQYMLDYNEYEYSMYGLPYDKTDAENIADAQAEAIEALTESAVVTAKIEELGYNTLTAEEEEELAAQVKEDFQLYYDTIEMFYFSATELTGDELKAAVIAEMGNLGYPTSEEVLLESMRMSKQSEKLYNDVIKDVAVTDEDVAAEYQSRVDAAKSTYEASPASYGTDVTNGAEPYFAPEGYRYVKHILVKIPDEELEAIEGLNAELAVKKAEKTEEANEELDKQIADLEAQVTAATEAAFAGLQTKVDEINAKLAEGADFNELITEYNEDPGMTAESAGYPVSADTTNFVLAFKDGAMALANVGDVSEPVRSPYGYHIIQYASDIPAGEIGLENVKTAIYDELLAQRQEAAYTSALDQWVAEADVKVYEDRMR